MIRTTSSGLVTKYFNTDANALSARLGLCGAGAGGTGGATGFAGFAGAAGATGAAVGVADSLSTPPFAT